MKVVLIALIVLALAVGCGGQQQGHSATNTSVGEPVTATTAPTAAPTIPGLTASAVVNQMASSSAWTCTSSPPQWECRYSAEPVSYWLRLEGSDDTHIRRVEGYVNAVKAQQPFWKDFAVSRLSAFTSRLNYNGYDQKTALAWLAEHGGGGSTVLGAARWSVTATPPTWKLEVTAT